MRGGAPPGAGVRIVVVDRVKSLFKLAAGEFVAPQRIEQLFEAYCGGCVAKNFGG